MNRKRFQVMGMLILLTISIETIGQDNVGSKKHVVGILAGATLSSLSNSQANSRAGFMGGLYWEVKLSERLSAMPNLLYIERGAEGLKLAYLSLPLQLKYNINEKFSMASGIAWDDLLSVNGGSINGNQYNIYDWRIPITIGYNISNRLAVGLNYNFGLSDITVNDNMTVRNNWGSLGLVYKIKGFD